MDKGLNTFSQWVISDSEVAAIRQYLVFRGLSSTSKTFENEVKQDRDKHLMVDKMIDQIQSYISSYDIVNLRDYWLFLEQRIFVHADPSLGTYTHQLWTGVLRIYLCTAAATARQDKLVEFFEKMAPYLITSLHSDWKDWFVFPYVKNPEEKAQYALYFSRQWQDTLLLSLANFLSIVINNLPCPTILDFERSEKLINSLKEENIALKNKIDELSKNQSFADVEQCCNTGEEEDNLPPIDERLLPDATENSDDFNNISQSASSSAHQPPSSAFVKMIKNFGSAPSAAPSASKPVAKIIPKKSAHNDPSNANKPA